MTIEKIKELEEKVQRIENDIGALCRVASKTLGATQNALKRIEKLEKQYEDKVIDDSINMYR